MPTEYYSKLKLKLKTCKLDAKNDKELIQDKKGFNNDKYTYVISLPCV